MMNTLVQWFIPTLCAASVGLAVLALASLPITPRLPDTPDMPGMPGMPGMRLHPVLRWLSLPVDVLVPVAGLLLAPARRSRLLRRLHHAGLERVMAPEQFEALCLLGASSLAVVAMLLTGAPAAASSGGLLEFAVALLRGALLGALVGWIGPLMWLRGQVRKRNAEVSLALPFYLDLMTLCVEAGLSLQMALERTVNKGPSGLLRDEFRRVLRDLSAGRRRSDVFRELAERLDLPGVVHFAMAIVRAERMGLNVGPVLRAQSDQERAERFVRAERFGHEAPVKMLLPLVLFVFPCTFIVILFPLAMQFLGTAH